MAVLDPDGKPAFFFWSAGRMIPFCCHSNGEDIQETTNAKGRAVYKNGPTLLRKPGLLRKYFHMQQLAQLAESHEKEGKGLQGSVFFLVLLKSVCLLEIGYLNKLQMQMSKEEEKSFAPGNTEYITVKLICVYAKNDCLLAPCGTVRACFSWWLWMRSPTLTHKVGGQTHCKHWPFVQILPLPFINFCHGPQRSSENLLANQLP